MEGKLPIFKVFFDLLYDEGYCFSGMDSLDEWPIVRVKLLYSAREGGWLTLQLLLHAGTLICIILFNIENRRHSGNCTAV
uniref:Uncharacterized protein n=1 Tax=Torque teno Leptonychotes weddellii virus-1 TaxID=2012676 RepID=A0A1Z2RW88_9VIRU|nr:hypothetical protein [Torque teno Leptonychotes weddellii virus 1]ASA48860.1 hypothetical protein [Torque teno Leptonychotes weddellii virus 1]ASA49064.1 hypothetical protein [Torque teno Leptonychotes weddellii virus 1]WCS65474.1 hypothetical protein [Torque teno Leptonychotes weddellii virus 1]WCS65478.1 hypothetical protein [Torque teno Leptonychotes weddellii virus 1]